MGAPAGELLLLLVLTTRNGLYWRWHCQAVFVLSRG